MQQKTFIKIPDCSHNLNNLDMHTCCFMYFWKTLQGHYVVLEKKHLVILPQTSCSQRKGSPEYCLKLDRWQRPSHINKVKQYEIELNNKQTNWPEKIMVCLRIIIKYMFLKSVKIFLFWLKYLYCTFIVQTAVTPCLNSFGMLTCYFIYLWRTLVIWIELLNKFIRSNLPKATLLHD